MASADSRILTMKFENSQFQRGVSSTMSSLDKLKAKMSFSSATNAAKTHLGGLLGSLGRFVGLRNPFAKSTQGVQELQGATNRFTMAPMTGAVTGVSKGFIAMSTVAVTALATITHSAITAGAQFAKSLSLDQVIGGFKEYEIQMNSIQTILANTGLEGDKGLAKVTTKLDELNHYADKTIYNFSEMAKNIGTFTAAGVDLDTSVRSIKGIANLAALSGSNSQQASTAMYQLSQALAAGKVSLMDWNSVVNAGMGGKVFQEALIRTATTLGTVKDNAVKTVGPMKSLSINGQSFRESISATGGKQWLTAEVLTSTLSQLSGDMTKAEMQAEGFTAAQIKAIEKMGKTGQDAATKVKTLTQLIDTTREAISSGWAQSFELIFGDFNEAKKLFTDVADVIGGIVGDSADARNKMLSDWKSLGGRTVLIESLGNAFHALMDILRPIGDAFRDVFPAQTGQTLYDLTVRLREFTEGLSISDETAENLKSTFRGVFSIFSIAGKIIGGVVGVIARLVGALGDGEGGLLNFTGGIGDFLYSVDQALEKGDGLANFFEGLGDVLEVPVKLLAAVVGWIGDLFSGFDGSAAKDLDTALGDIGEKLSPLEVLGERVSSVFEGLGGIFDKVRDALEPLTSAIGDALGNFWSALSDTFSGNFDTILDTVNTGLLAGLLVLFRRFVNEGMSLFGGGQGVLGKIGQSFDAVTGSLEAMQANLQSKTLMNLAIAIGLLTISVVALSLIDSAKLTKALTAISVAFAQLLGAMAILTKISGAAGFLKVPMIAGAMIMLATALLILTGAVRNLSDLDWEELAKGLIGVAGAMAILAGGATLMSGLSGPLLRAGASMVLLSIGLRIMAEAVEAFGEMDLGTMVKGLIGVAGALLIVAGAMAIMPPNMFVTAAALTVLGVALNLIANAVEEFGSLGAWEIAKGLVAMAGALLIIAGAMWIMPPHMILMAAGLIGVGIAINLIGNALQTMGGMGWEEIAKGLVALAGSLAILAAGLYLMTGTIAGAAALVVAAGALMMLVPSLVILGSLSWEAILKGLVALAGAFTVLGLAGLILTPLSPVLLALGAAVALLGAGVLMTGAGIYFLAKAFRIISSAGNSALKVLGGAIGTFIKAIPKAAKAFALGLIEFVKIIARSGSTFVRAFSTILSSILKAIIRNAPLIQKAFMRLLDLALTAVTRGTPKVVRAGLRMIVEFLRAIRDYVPRIINIAADIAVKFINGIARNQGRIIQAGVNMIISFINGLARAIDNNSARMGEAGGRLAMAIVRGMASGIRSGASVVIDAAGDMAADALNWAKSKLGISSPSKAFFDVGKWSAVGASDGFRAYSGVVNKSAEYVGKGALNTLKATMSGMSQAVSSELDINPTVRPVLDLSEVRRNADKMSSIFGDRHLRADVSLSRAASISADRQAARDTTPDTPIPQEPKEIKFEQHNHSPKALSAVEIYRNTKSQLALAKEALTNDSRPN